MQAQEQVWTLTARWIVPVDQPPLKQGTLTISRRRLVHVDPQGRRRADQDLGNVAILPGLVNSHTHLDLSGLHGRVPPTADFTAWLRAIMHHRRSQTPAQVQADTRAGLAAALASGTTLLGDISDQGLSWPVLAEGPVRGVVFYELLGLTRVRAQQTWAAACQWLRNHPGSERLRPGLSPHAPYSVRRSLFRAASHLAQQQQLPVAIHTAESTAELELLGQHTGPFHRFLKELGVWDAEGLVTSPAELLELNRAVAHLLLIHGNYLEPTIAVGPNRAVVYCPRTHAVFQHSPHPFRELLAAGVRVALGTDSLASNPDLDLFAEARYLHEHYPDVPGSVLVRMATLDGAAALGLSAEVGTLTPGKRADLVVLGLPNQETSDPCTLLLESAPPVQGVLCDGRWVWGPS
jgi:cytosine/adenosine deaminase-related metal-dependent hydrolase